jgi:hypothetical protein
MQVYQNGKGGPEVPIHAKNGINIDISTVVPISSTPVGTAGTSPGGGVTCSAGSVAIPWFNGSLNLCDQHLTDDGAGSFGVVNLNATTAITTPQITTTGAGFLLGPFKTQTTPANPSATFMECWGDSTANQFKCINSDGSNALPGGGSGVTLQTNGVNNTSQTTLNFVTSPAFNGITLTPSNPGGVGNEQFTFTGTLNNAGLTNPSTTVNGTTCTLGSTCSISGSAPTIVNGSSDTLTAAGTFATQASITAGSTSFIEIRAHGVFTTTGTASPVAAMQVNAGGTTGLCTHTGTNALNSSLTNDSWDVVCYVSILSTGAPGTASTWGLDEITNANANGGFVSKQFPQNAATQNFTTTTAQTVSIQETGTLVAGESFTLQQLIIRTY